MKVQRVLWAVFFAAIAALAGCSGTPPQAVHGTPASARVAFENDKVRVIEYHTGSGKEICGFGMHTHPRHVYIMLTDAKLRVVTPDGKESFEDAKAGEVGWADPEHHVAENLSGNDAGCYIIEIKDEDSETFDRAREATVTLRCVAETWSGQEAIKSRNRAASWTNQRE